MKVSGFTIVKDIIKYNYPVLESIQSILPICDEFIVNVSRSQDDTLNLIQSLKNSKIKIMETKWDLSMGKTVLSYQTNAALKECKGDWAFYLQADEVVHERDLPILRKLMEKYIHDDQVDALRFRWFHFYGSYFRYRIDEGWYQKQDRIIKNNGRIESFGDAYSFKRKDDQPLRFKNTGCFIYHYGWVQPEEVMSQRRLNAEKIGFITLQDQDRDKIYTYGDLNRFPVYFGTHPQGMEERIKNHLVSQEDLKEINRRYFFHPLRILKVRCKTGKRINTRIT